MVNKPIEKEQGKTEAGRNRNIGGEEGRFNVVNPWRCCLTATSEETRLKSLSLVSWGNGIKVTTSECLEMSPTME